MTAGYREGWVRSMRGVGYLILGVLVIYAALLPDVAKRRTLTAVYTGATVALLAVFAVHAALTIQHSLASPPVWDYRAFWVYGRGVDVTHRPYEPRALQNVAASLSPDASFTREVLDVGLVYPPATTLLVAPLGVFASPRLAAPVWYALLCLFLVAQVVLLWRHFLRNDGWSGLLAASLIVALLPTTLAVLSIGQTLFIAEVFLLLYLADTHEWRGGIWLALAVLVKPFAAVVVLYPIVRRQWRVLAACAAAYVTATLCTIPLIGWKSIVSFFTRAPGARQPASVLTANANQSILAWIVRTHRAPEQVQAALHSPLYLIIAVVLLTVTLWRISGVREDRDYCVTLLLTLSLLVYPQAMWHYTSMLSIPLCLLWSRRNAIPHGAALAAAFTALVFLFARTEDAQILDFVLAWVVIFSLPHLEKALRKPAAVASL